MKPIQPDEGDGAEQNPVGGDRTVGARPVHGRDERTGEERRGEGGAGARRERNEQLARQPAVDQASRLEPGGAEDDRNRRAP